MSKVKPDRRAEIEHDAGRDAQTGNHNPPGGVGILATDKEREEHKIYQKEYRRHKK